MTMDTFLTIMCLVGFVVSYAGYRWFSENVYLTCKDQRVGE